MSAKELTAAVRYQVGALKGFLHAEGLPLHHVKPRDVLYGMMYRNRETYRAMYAGVPKGTTVFGLAGIIHEVAKEMGLSFVAEIYGDVKYNLDKTLIDRKRSTQSVLVFKTFSKLSPYHVDMQLTAKLLGHGLRKKLKCILNRRSRILP